MVQPVSDWISTDDRPRLGTHMDQYCPADQPFSRLDCAGRVDWTARRVDQRGRPTSSGSTQIDPAARWYEVVPWSALEHAVLLEQPNFHRFVAS